MHKCNVSASQDQTKCYCSQYLTGQFFRDKISLEHVSHDLCFSLDNHRDIFSIESYMFKVKFIVVFHKCQLNDFLI